MTKKEDGTFNLSDKKVKFWTDEINSETADKKRDLERELEKKVDEGIDGQFQAMLKDLKLDKPFEIHKTSCKELEDFENQKDLKEQSLKDKKKETARNMIDLFNRQATIHGWSTLYEGDIELEDIERHILNICRDEVRKKLEKTTPEGKLLQDIDGQRKTMLRALNQPKLKFKEVDFNQAISKGFSAIGIAYKPMDIEESEGAVN